MNEEPFEWETINAWSLRSTGQAADRYRITISRMSEGFHFLCWVKSDRVGSVPASYRPIDHIPEVGNMVHAQKTEEAARHICKLHYFQGLRIAD